MSHLAWCCSQVQLRLNPGGRIGNVLAHVGLLCESFSSPKAYQSANRWTTKRPHWSFRHIFSHASLLALTCYLLLASHFSIADELYQYTDSSGVVYITNVPDNEHYQKIPTTPTIASPKLRGEVAGNEVSDQGNAIDKAVSRAAIDHQLDENLIKAVIAVESNRNPRAISSKGAQGLMQIMPATASRFGMQDPFDTTQNITTGSKYLKQLLALFNGDVELALAGYNAGENAIIRYGNRIPPFKETQAYVKLVLLKYRQLSNRTRSESPFKSTITE